MHSKYINIQISLKGIKTIDKLFLIAILSLMRAKGSGSVHMVYETCILFTIDSNYYR